jgi:hypothetical protein
MKSTSDGHYKQCAVVEFTVAVTEKVNNIHTWLSNVYGNVAVNRSIICSRAKRMRDGDIGAVQLLDIFHQLQR